MHKTKLSLLLPIGGIGIGDRAFPSQPGLSYSTWICVEKFSDPRTDPHPVRLLTIARTVKENSKEESYACLAVALSARDKALIVRYVLMLIFLITKSV